MKKKMIIYNNGVVVKETMEETRYQIKQNVYGIAIKFIMLKDTEISEFKYNDETITRRREPDVLSSTSKKFFRKPLLTVVWKEEFIEIWDKIIPLEYASTNTNRCVNGVVYDFTTHEVMVLDNNGSCLYKKRAF